MTRWWSYLFWQSRTQLYLVGNIYLVLITKLQLNIIYSLFYKNTFFFRQDKNFEVGNVVHCIFIRSAIRGRPITNTAGIHSRDIKKDGKGWWKKAKRASGKFQRKFTLTSSDFLSLSHSAIYYMHTYIHTYLTISFSLPIYKFINKRLQYTNGK